MVQVACLEVMRNTLDLCARRVVDVRIQRRHIVNGSLELWIRAVIEDNDAEAVRWPVHGGCGAHRVGDDIDVLLAARDKHVDCRRIVTDDAKFLAQPALDEETLPELMAQHGHCIDLLAKRCMKQAKLLLTSDAHLDGDEGPCHSEDSVGRMLGRNGILDSEGEVHPVRGHGNQREHGCALVNAALPRW